MRPSIPAGLACSLVLLYPAVQAQTLTAQTQVDDTVEELIVTANRFPQVAGQTMTAHSILDREAIERSAAASLFDLLGSVPGLQLARTGTEGAQTSLFMRGSNSNHTLILLDGVRINTATEGAARLENVPLDHIERIEVVRGPQSSLYGADAIGGVVQIFTVAADTAGGQDLSGDVAVGAGTEQSRLAHGSLQGRVGSTRLGLELSHRETDGIPPQNAPVVSTQRAPYENSSASLRIQHDLGERASLWTSYLASEAEKAYEGGHTDAAHRSGAIAGRAVINDTWTSRLQLGYFKDANVNYSPAVSHNTTWRDSLQWQNEFHFHANTTTVLGIDLEEEELLYQNPGAVLNTNTRENHGLFAVHEQSLGKYTATLSARRDKNDQFGYHTTGRLAIGRDLGGTTRAWFAAGTAFKAPTLIDLYVDFPAFGFYANPELAPEKARNIEIGLSTTLLDTYLTINVFRNDIRELINIDSNFTSLTNIGRARIDGVELGAQRDILGWQTALSVTLLDHENRDTGAKLTRRADEQMHLSVSREFNNTSVLLDWQVVGARTDLDPVTFGPSTVGGYGVLDAVMSWQVNPSLNVQFKAGNILDNNYEVVDGYNTLGRHAMLTARQQF